MSLNICSSSKTPRANPNVNYGLWVLMRCQCRFINYNGCTLWLHTFSPATNNQNTDSQVWAITWLPPEKSINPQRLLQQHSLLLHNHVTVTATRPQSLPTCRASNSTFRPITKREQRAKDHWTFEKILWHKRERPKQTGPQNKTETQEIRKKESCIQEINTGSFFFLIFKIHRISTIF